MINKSALHYLCTIYLAVEFCSILCNAFYFYLLVIIEMTSQGAASKRHAWEVRVLDLEACHLWVGLCGGRMLV